MLGRSAGVDCRERCKKVGDAIGKVGNRLDHPKDEDVMGSEVGRMGAEKTTPVSAIRYSTSTTVCR